MKNNTKFAKKCKKKNQRNGKRCHFLEKKKAQSYKDVISFKINL